MTARSLNTNETDVVDYGCSLPPSSLSLLASSSLSLPAHADQIALKQYTACDAVTSSDHKPVRAIFELRPSPALPPAPPRAVAALLARPSLFYEVWNLMKR